MQRNASICTITHHQVQPIHQSGRGGVSGDASPELCFPPWSIRFATGRVERTQCIRGTYAERMQDGVSRRDIRKKLVFQFNSHFLSDFLKLSVDLAVSSISSDSRIVRESPPVSIHAETPSNGSLRKSESHRQSQSKLRPHQKSQTGGWVRSFVRASRSTTTSHSSSGTGWFRRPVWASLLPDVPGLRFVLLYLSGGPGADGLGHTGSLPGCAEQGLIFPEGGKVVVRVELTACRF